MKLTFHNLFKSLQSELYVFDSARNTKSELLTNIAASKLPITKKLISYIDLLLFISTYPQNKTEYEMAQIELERAEKAIKKIPRKKAEHLYYNLQAPHSPTVGSYTFTFTNWLVVQTNINCSIDSFGESTIALNEILPFALPSMLKDISSIGLNNTELYSFFNVEKNNRLNFILSITDQVKSDLALKEYLFDKLNLYIKISPADRSFSKAFNKYNSPVFYSTSILKNFNATELLNSKLSSEKKLSNNSKTELMRVIRCSLALLQRETDPAVYTDYDSIKYFELERGFSVALYGIKAQQQLAIESYIGYTLFKNGYPYAYGGAWVLGKRALFGINIFETYRGGESGYAFMQLLRTYRQVFNVCYFEVEPYQYGQDNPDGIKSGAFWFYYKFGFKPTDPQLRKLAEQEYDKIKTKKGYRTSKETLLKFTESNISYSINNANIVPVQMSTIREYVLHKYNSVFNINFQDAENLLEEKLLKKITFKQKLNSYQLRTLREGAYLMEYFKYSSKKKLSALKQFILIKHKNPYKAQMYLLELLN